MVVEAAGEGAGEGVAEGAGDGVADGAADAAGKSKVGNRIDVPLDPLAAVVLQVKALLTLQGLIGIITLIQGVRDEQFLGGNRLVSHRPAPLLEIGDPGRVVLHPRHRG